MAAKKRRAARPWWRRGKPLRRLALAASLTTALGFLVFWLVAGGQGGSSDDYSEYMGEPAPTFSLPTISGDEFSLADHLGRHNLLLYFNEGIG